MMIENQPHIRLDIRTWEVPTGHPGEQLFIGVLVHSRSNVMVVQAMSTFVETGRRYGDYACYMGCSPTGEDDYQRAAWVAENGLKLTERQSFEFGARTVAPNGVYLRWRA